MPGEALTKVLRQFYRFMLCTGVLSDVKKIGCKSAWPVHVSPLFWAIGAIIARQHRQSLPSPNRIFASILQVGQVASVYRFKSWGSARE